MQRLKSIIVEAHRRSLWQVLGIYAVSAWIGYQIVNELTSGLGLPDWVPGFAVVLFIIGLPVVLATAFVQEGLPSARRDPDPAELRALADLTLRSDLEVPPADAAAAAAEPAARGRHHVLFTWQRAVLGGITAFLLLGITAGGYMGMRNAGIGAIGSLVAKGTLAERERVLISEFSGADTELAAMLTQAFRVDFSQSSVVTVVDAAYVRGVLARMEREPSLTLDVELARDVALRDGIKAIVTGEIHRAAAGYVLSASLIGIADNAVLASFRETAADSTQVLAAVDKLSKKLRERIGESLRTIRANQPLAAVTTASLDALRKYTQAVRALDEERDFATGIALLQEALAIDSMFGMAWRKLAVAHSNNGDGYRRYAPATTRAYQLRDRMTAYERDAAIAYYHMYITRDMRAVIAAYRSMLETHPTDRIALNNVGIAYHRVGDHELAVQSYRASIAADSSTQSSWTNLAGELLELGRPDEAERLLDDYERKFGVTDAGLWRRYHLAGLRRDYDAALAVATRMSGLRTGAAGIRSAPLWMRSSVAEVQGQLREGSRFEREAVALDLERGAGMWRGLAELGEAERTLWQRRDPEAALRILGAALKTYPLEQLETTDDRPYRRIARVYAHAGRTARARELYAERQRTMSEERRATDLIAPRWADFHVAFGAGSFEDALRVLRSLEPDEICTACLALPLAEAFDRMGQPDSAIHHYERFIALPATERIYEDYGLASAHERLAELYHERADRVHTLQHAARFVELWAKADADLQPRVRAKNELLLRLTAEGAR